jgi:hypothetical protein
MGRGGCVNKIIGNLGMSLSGKWWVLWVVGGTLRTGCDARYRRDVG